MQSKMEFWISRLGFLDWTIAPTVYVVVATAGAEARSFQEKGRQFVVGRPPCGYGSLTIPCRAVLNAKAFSPYPTGSIIAASVDVFTAVDVALIS